MWATRAPAQRKTRTSADRSRLETGTTHTDPPKAERRRRCLAWLACVRVRTASFFAERPATCGESLIRHTNQQRFPGLNRIPEPGIRAASLEAGPREFRSESWRQDTRPAY